MPNRFPAYSRAREQCGSAAILRGQRVLSRREGGGGKKHILGAPNAYGRAPDRSKRTDSASSSCCKPLHPVAGNGLQLTQTGVNAALCQQLPIAPAFHDPAFAQHDDPVGVPDCREAMSEHDRRPHSQQLLQRVMNLGLGLGIDVCRGFVEQEERSFPGQGPGISDQLLLTVESPAARSSKGSSKARPTG